jgi:RNA polymerase sigma-70 factor (ECF subfamily)
MDQQAVNRLIELSVRGDDVSFRKLVEMHQAFAWSVAFRLLNKQFETEEVVQEAFIRVWKKLPVFRNEIRFSTWLYKIVVNLCYDYLKAEKARKKISDRDSSKDLTILTSDENVEKDMVNREQADLIRMLTSKLSSRQKVVFVLSELEELPVDEISAITGMTPSKIKSNLYCARREIREKLTAITNTRGSYAI